MDTTMVLSRDSLGDACVHTYDACVRTYVTSPHIVSSFALTHSSL